ncbi:hypothetical protein D3878_00345 [Noviherbaspirillum sedimenti]|uniref:Tle cognate immunity protein 4 C-terminal domain-containing protein n=1 Tax=Noviherbaspirillum sedimenti TaxID=2320865 RepID=A0A3A3GDA0_9BURK|nr:hypothetical protein D3878_00345 [Noviherbaspirillum sedimenti]
MIIFGVLAVVTTVLFRINTFSATANAQEKKNMEPYTQNMKKQCYGRFLVDIPQQSKEGGKGTYEFGFANISVGRHEKTMPHFQAYATSIKESYAAQRTLENAPRLVHAETISDDARFIAYYDDDFGIVFKTLGLVKKENILFKVEAHGSEKPELEAFSQNLQNLIPHLKPRANNEIPTGPGFCMDGAIITTQHKKGEYYSSGFTLPEFPELYFGFSTNVNGDKVDPGIIDREANIIKDLGGFITQIKTIRKGRRMINGMEAQEWLTRLPPGDTHEYSFELDIVGKPNSISESRISVGMRLTGSQVGNKREPVKMTEAEALLLWDAVTSTIRPRPGAV